MNAAGSQQGTDDDSVNSLIEHLGPAEGERAVYSAIYRREESGFHLQYASLLIGPEAMASGSWGAWMLGGAERLNDRFQLLSEVPAEGLVESAPVEGDAEVVAGRFVIEVDQMRSWLTEAVGQQTVPQIGELPEARALLLAPSSPQRVFPRLWTPVSRLAATTIRPLRGFFFPLAEEGAPLVAGEWEVGGVTAYDGPWSTLGIALPNEGHSFEAPPAGLLVGRLERRAWFNDVRGDGAFDRYQLHIGIEPEQIDVSELAVELEEWSGEELVNVRRLALGDLKLGQRAGADRFLVALPTLGRGFAHAARLYDREGVLLDCTQRAHLVERMVGRGKVRGPDGAVATQHFSVGERVEVGLGERLARFDRVEDDYREMLREGLEERIITTRTRGAEVLRNELARVSKPVSILDPYFGYKPADWNVLAGLNVAIRILSGSGAKRPPANLANVEVRRWRHSGNPPFHDRSYLWEGGGLSVGTSPSGLGNRDARLDRMGATEATALRASFEAYWQSGDFR